MSTHGIKTGKVKVDLDTMMERKNGIVDALTSGINMLLKKNKVKSIVGRGRLVGPGRIQVSEPQSSTVEADRVVIATGSVPMMLPGIEVDGDHIGDSTTALSYPSVPKKLVVIGGGYIGLELGSVWSRLGSEVVVLEAMDDVLAGLDGEIAKHARRAFEKQGLTFTTGAFVESAVRKGKGCEVTCRDMESITCDRVLMCAGRVPNTGEIGLDGVGVETDRRGNISVDEDFQTNVNGVYAIGDCIGGAMLAHKASEEGIACIEKNRHWIRSCQLRCDSGNRLYASGNRFGRLDRRAACRIRN